MMVTVQLAMVYVWVTVCWWPVQMGYWWCCATMIWMLERSCTSTAYRRSTVWDSALWQWRHVVCGHDASILIFSLCRYLEPGWCVHLSANVPRRRWGERLLRWRCDGTQTSAGWRVLVMMTELSNAWGSGGEDYMMQECAVWLHEQVVCVAGCMVGSALVMQWCVNVHCARVAVRSW